MPNYFDAVESDLEPKFVANVNDIKLIQSNIETAFVQTIIDNLGDAYVISDEDDSFELTPIENLSTGIYDQIHEVNNDWQDIQDLYVLQKIPLAKSSVEKIYLSFKNESLVDNINVNTELLDGNQELLGSATLEIPANTAATQYELSFAEHHLPIDNVYLKIKRTNTAGVYIEFDNTGSYESGMQTSPDDSDYEDINGDLYFKQSYATQSTFDVTKGVAVIQGNKIHNLDSHVTIPPASAFGDRIDIVVMDRDGTFDVIEGTPATEPEEPTPDEDRLIIAYVTVYQNQPQSVNMDVDQDRTLGRTRLKSIPQRVRDVEQELNWRSLHDIPERIKYNLSGTSLIGSGSSNMTWDGDLSAYRLTSNEIVRKAWTFKGDENIASTYQIDHSDHTNGIIKLATTTYNYEEVYIGHDNTHRSVTSRVCRTYRNKSKVSRYPGGFFTIKNTRKLTQVGVDLRRATNVNRARIIVCKRVGKNLTHFETSNWVSASNFDQRLWMPTYYTFSGTKWLTPGEYAFIVMPEPKYTSTTKPGILIADVWYSYTKGINNNAYGEWIGWYPVTIPSSDTGSYRYGVTLASRPGRSMGTVVKTQAPGYTKYGTVTSSPLATGSGIASVTVDKNLVIPSETYYKLEVSNDGGNNFFQMSGDSYTFTSQSGQSFVWRLTLNTNNTAKTPYIQYSTIKQYAIKFTLTLSAGSPPTSGQLVSAIFNGPGIVQYALGYSQNVGDALVVDRFSRFEWLRLWASNNDGFINIDFEGSDDGTYFNTVKAGVNLEEISQGPTMYGEAVDPDEYNYNAIVNMNVLTDQEVIEPCETAWTSDDLTNVTCTADSSSPYEGTYSAKMELIAGATTGLIAHKERTASLIGYDTVQITVKSSVALAAGDFKFRIGADEDCTDILEEFDIPAISSTGSWITFEFKLNDPTLLSQVKSFGIEQVVDKGALNFNIDSIKAMTLGLRLLEDCETLWTEDKASNMTISLESGGSYVKQGTYSNKIVFDTDPGTGLMTHKAKTPTLDLTDMKQIRFWLYTTTNIAAGDWDFLIGSDTGCTSILESHSLPAIGSGRFVRITFDLDEPSLLGAVASFGLRLNQASYTTGTLYIDAIEGLATESVPFYQKYVRFRLNMFRALGTDTSPTVHKLGVIPRFI